MKEQDHGEGRADRAEQQPPAPGNPRLEPVGEDADADVADQAENKFGNEDGHPRQGRLDPQRIGHEEEKQKRGDVAEHLARDLAHAIGHIDSGARRGVDLGEVRRSGQGCRVAAETCHAPVRPQVTSRRR